MKWHFGIVHMLRPREVHKMNLCIVVPDIITHTHTHTPQHTQCYMYIKQREARKFPEFSSFLSWSKFPSLIISNDFSSSLYSYQFSSDQFSRSVVSDSLWPHESQHARPPCASPAPGVHSDSRQSSQWCHPAISSSVVPFSSCPQSLPESFPMSQLFEWGGQITGVSALASFLPRNTQDWSPLEWTGWIPLQSKGLSRVFSNTTVQKHQFFGTQLSSQSNSHIHTWLPEKP